MKGVAATASSARVLDLITLALAPPDTADGQGVELDPAAGPQEPRPMFQHPLLNRTIIVKHNMGPTEEDRMAPRRIGATKIIFPFDAKDLSLGGQYLFVDQPDFVGALTRHLNYRDLPLDRDVAVLRMLDKLPTLDPFLVHGALAQKQITVDRRYHRLSAIDRADMLGFVVGEIRALIELCFRGAKVDEARAQRLSERLLGDQDGAELDLLRQSLRMERSEFSEAMFTWKGFLYYRWRARELTPQLKATLQSFSRIRRRNFEREELAHVMRCKAVLQKTIAEILEEVAQRLRRYDHAFSGLTKAEDPDSFRRFLLQGSALFLELGERIGRLEQLVSFWRERFGGDRLGAMSPDDVLDGMRDLLQALAISTLSPTTVKTYEPDAAVA